MNDIQPTEVKYICSKCNKLGLSIYPNAIRELRLKTHKTAFELAATANVHPSYWSYLETGKRSLDGVSHKILQKIAAALNVEVDDLFIKTKAA